MYTGFVDKQALLASSETSHGETILSHIVHNHDETYWTEQPVSESDDINSERLEISEIAYHKFMLNKYRLSFNRCTLVQIRNTVQAHRHIYNIAVKEETEIRGLKGTKQVFNLDLKDTVKWEWEGCFGDGLPDGKCMIVVR